MLCNLEGRSYVFEKDLVRFFSLLVKSMKRFFFFERVDGEATAAGCPDRGLAAGQRFLSKAFFH